MYGLPFLLSDEAKENNDNALLVNVGFDYIKSIKDSLSWQSNLSGSWTDYQDLNNLDSIYISFSTGATWRQNSHMIWSMPLVTDWLKFGYNENYYSYSYGLAPQLRYVINKTLSANIATSISRKEYQNSVDRALMAYSFSPSFDYKILQDGTIRIALTAATERSGLDFFSNNQFGINGLYFHNFSKNLVTTIRVGYSDTNYLQNELAYPDERHDKTIRYGFDIVYHIEPIASEVVFTINQTNNSSNIDMYDYDRTQTSLLLRKAF